MIKSVIVLLSVMSSLSAFADRPEEVAALKISSTLKQELAAGKTQALVILKTQADLSGARSIADRTQRIHHVYTELVRHANATQQVVVNLLLQKQVNFQRYFISNAILVNDADRALVDSLSRMPDVKKIVANKAALLKLPFETESLNAGIIAGAGDNIAATGAERVWNELKIQGQGIVVAGQDTGYQWDHPALKNAYRGFNNGQASHDYNWHDSIHQPFNPDVVKGLKKNKCGYNVPAPCDDDRHGTHTMGTIVGSDGGANQVGMAPKARWIGCRNMDAGVGQPATYLECFQFFLAPTPLKGDPFKNGRAEYAPHVINNSWGCPGEEGCSGDEFIPALKALKDAGIIVVVSAGNEGPGCSTIADAPAHHSDLGLSVGAYNHRNDKIASFSSRGPSKFDGKVGPDIVAPGVSIRSSVPGNGYDGGMWSGTSMAGPHVVGQVALILSANKNFIGKVDEVRALIRKTAAPMTTSESCGGVSGSTIPNNTYGFGKIQVFESVKAAQSIR